MDSGDKEHTYDDVPADYENGKFQYNNSSTNGAEKFALSKCPAYGPVNRPRDGEVSFHMSTCPAYGPVSKPATSEEGTNAAMYATIQ